MAIKKWVIENFNKGFISDIYAPFASLILFIKKANSFLRLYINYWKLNLITKKDLYLIPLISELLLRVTRAKVFIKLNICATFN